MNPTRSETDIEVVSLARASWLWEVRAPLIRPVRHGTMVTLPTPNEWPVRLAAGRAWSKRAAYRRARRARRWYVRRGYIAA